MKINKEKEEKGKKQKVYVKQEKKPKEKLVSNNLSYKERLEMKSLAENLERLEEQKSEMEEKLASGELEGKSINDFSIKLGDLIENIDEITLLWMELADRD